MAGWFGYDEATDEALMFFPDRVPKSELNDNIYFDLWAVIKSVSKEKESTGSSGTKSGWYS